MTGGPYLVGKIGPAGTLVDLVPRWLGVTTDIDNILILGISPERKIIRCLPIVIDADKGAVLKSTGQSLAGAGALTAHILPGGALVQGAPD